MDIDQLEVKAVEVLGIVPRGALELPGGGMPSSPSVSGRRSWPAQYDGDLGSAPGRGF
jgi:hypothetical protein